MVTRWSLANVIKLVQNDVKHRVLKFLMTFDT